MPECVFACVRACVCARMCLCACVRAAGFVRACVRVVYAYANIRVYVYVLLRPSTKKDTYNTSMNAFTAV